MATPSIRFDTPGVSPLKQTKYWLNRETAATTLGLKSHGVDFVVIQPLLGS
jgi:hypothetical protein